MQCGVTLCPAGDVGWGRSSAHVSRRDNPEEEQEAVSLGPTHFQRRQELPVAPRARALGRLQEEVTQVGGGDEQRTEMVDFKGRLTKKRQTQTCISKFWSLCG